MQWHCPVSPARFAGAAVVLVGSCTGMATVGLAKATLAGSVSTPLPVTIEATHLPPLLTLPGESARLEYDTFCMRADAADVDGEDVGCETSGSVFVRPEPGTAFTELALTPSGSGGSGQLSVDVPRSVASASQGFSYYAVMRAPGAAPVTIPPGGAAAPHVSRPVGQATPVDLGRHVFGAARHADERVASVAWGSGASDAGLEQGPNTEPIGASAFEVDDAGTLLLLDEVHRRVFRWSRQARRPQSVPVSVTGTLADMTVAQDGSIYVLETVGKEGSTPLVRRFDPYGRELDVAATAERTASQIRMSPEGPVVLQQPAHQWMPMAADNRPAAAGEQQRRARVGRPLGASGEVVVLRSGREIRVALTGRAGVRRAWRITSDTDIAEVQLAEPLGNRLVVVARVYTDERDEFVVLLLDRRGLVRRFSLAADDWAETAPLGRFKLAGSSLYRLGSTPAGVFVDRFDLEVR